MSGTLDSWIVTNGSWSTAANWQHGLPNASSLASFGGTATETVTFATTASIDGLTDSDANATLNMTSGALTIATGGNWNGAFIQWGTLGLTAGQLTISGLYTGHSGASTTLAGGATLNLTGGGQLYGATTGAGTLLLQGGQNYSIGHVSALGSGTVDILDNGGTVSLVTGGSVAGAFLMDGGLLALGGTTLTLAGFSYIAGNSTIAGPGELAIEAPGTIGYAIVSAGATLLDGSTVIETGGLQLGTGTADTATLSIGAHGTYDLAYDDNISANGTANVINAGVLEKTGSSTGGSFIAANLASTGQIIINQGTLVLEGTTDTIGGSVSGAGALELAAGTLNLTTTALSVGAIDMYGPAVVNLSASPVYSGSFFFDGATLNIAAGDSLTLNGGDYLRGLIDGGVVTVAGSADLGYLSLSGGAKLVDAKLITADGPLTLGTGTADSASLTIDAGATFDLLYNTNSDINANGTAAIGNAGLFEMTGIGLNSIVFADMTSTGTLLATVSNTLQLEGASNALSGSLLGAGEIDLRGGGTFSIAAGTTLGVATLGIFDNNTVVRMAGTSSDAGTFELGGGATLDYAATGSLTLSGSADLDGTVLGPVVLTASGTAETGGLVLSGGAELVVSKLAMQNTAATIGTGTADHGTLDIVGGGTYDIAADVNINANGTEEISNNGVFEKTAATGTSIVYADIISSDEILGSSGTMALEGASNTIGGQGLMGVGEIDLRGGGQFQLTALASLDVATLGIYDSGTTVKLAASKTYGGAFTLGGGATLDLAGVTLTLGSASIDGVIDGGTAVVGSSGESAGMVLTGGATLDDTSFVMQSEGNATLGTGTADSATLLIKAGATYDIASDNNIGASGTAVISNGGVFEKTGYSTTGTSIVYADIVSSYEIVDTIGTLALEGASNTIGGTGLLGTGEIDLRGGGQFEITSVATLGVATLGIYDSGTTVTLEGSKVYAGTFTLGTSASLALNGHYFTLDGKGLLQGGIDGAGEYIVAGSADAQYLLLTDAATLAVTGTLTQDHYITLGAGTADNSTISVAAGGTYDLISDDSINAAGTATIANAGTFEKTETDGTSTVQASVVNTGKILADIGTINFQGTLTNDGTVTATAATVLVSSVLNEGSGDHGAFDIGTNGTVSVGTSIAVDAGQTFAFTGSNGTLRIYDPAAFGGTVTGFAAGDTIDLGDIQANGLSYSGGVLTVTETQNGTLEATYTISAPGIADPGALELVNDNADGTAIVLNHTGPAFTNPSGTIYEDTWTVDASGSWSDGGNWYQVVPAPPPIYSETLHVQPDAGNDANLLQASGTADFVVSYDETDTVNSLSGSVQATLEVSGGTLTINQGGDFGGGFDITGGTLDAVTGWAVYSGANLGTGATEEVDSGTFAVSTGTLAGTVDGQGEYYLIGGDNFTIDSGFTISSGIFDLGVDGDGFGSNTTLDTNLAYAGTFVLTDYTGNSANLYLNGHTLTLSGATGYLNGYISGTGRFVIAGTDEVGQLTVNNSATVTISGTAEQDGTVVTGNGTAPDATTLNITATGIWDFVNNSAIDGYGNSTIDNAGTIEKTGGTGGSNFGGSVFIDTGKMVVGVGYLDIGAANNTIEGAISGAGAAYFDGGLNFTLEAGTTITVATLELGVNGDGFGSNTTLDTSLGYAGTFRLDNYSGNTANLFLNGHTLTLSGSSWLNGYVSGPGVLAISGRADMPGLTVNNSATVNVTGTLTQDGLLTIGTGNTPDTTTITVASTGTYDFLNDSSVNVYGSATIDNAGLFEKTGGTGVTGIYGGTFINTGTMLISTGWIDVLSGELGGKIEGAGNLGLYVGTSTLEAGATVSVANVALLLDGDGFGATLVLDENFTYGGSFESYDYSGNATFLNLNGFTANFTGKSFWNGQLNGPGTLDLGGTATIAGQGDSDALVNVTGTAVSVGNLSMSNAAALAIAGGGVFDMLDDGNAETGAASVTNAGLIEKTAGVGTSYIQGNLTSTATIDAATGTIEFQDAASNTIGGTVEGAGDVQFDGGGVYTIDAGSVFSVAQLGVYGTLLLEGNISYAGSFSLYGGTVELNAHTLSLSGPAVLDGTVQGPGTLAIAQGKTATTNGLTLQGTAVLTDAGMLVSDGEMIFGTGSLDATTLDVTSTGVLNINSDNYSSSDGAPVIVNAGLIEKTGMTATGSLDAALTSTGTILVNQGTLLIETPAAGSSSIGGKVEGTGTLALQGGSSTLAPGVSLSIAALSLVGGATNVLDLSLSYAGDYTLNNATENLHGDTLTLTGSADLVGGTVTGPGTFEAFGTTTLGYVTVDDGATLDDNGGGALAQWGDLTLGDAGGSGTAENGATWNFIADGEIISEGSVEGAFLNGGLLEKTGGGGTSNIVANFTNKSAGRIYVATGTIELGPGAGTISLAGTVEGSGSLVVDGFATVSSLAVTGASPNFIDGLSVSGTIVDTGATLFAGGTLSGAGTIDLKSHAVAEIGGTVTLGTTLAFLDATDTIGLASPAGFAGTIAGLVAGDTIDLSNTPLASITGHSYAANTLTIDVAGGTIYTLKVPGSFTSGSFTFANDGHNGTAITV